MNIIVEATAAEVYQKYFAAKLTPEEYQKIISIDPTSQFTGDLNTSSKGKYSDWLVRQYLKAPAAARSRMVTEDSESIRSGLQVLGTLTANKAGLEKLLQIGQDAGLAIKNPADIASYSVEFVKLLASKADEAVATRTPKEKQIDVIINDSVMFCCIPKTHEAARKYGTGTSWCTATSTPHWYESYAARGPLFIIIDKADPQLRKWQFHHASHQLMNNVDQPIALTALIRWWYSKSEDHAEAMSALAEYFEKKLGYSEWNYEKAFSKNVFPAKLKELLQAYPASEYPNLRLKERYDYDVGATSGITARKTSAPVSLLGAIAGLGQLNALNLLHDTYKVEPILGDFIENDDRAMELLVGVSSDATFNSFLEHLLVYPQELTKKLTYALAKATPAFAAKLTGALALKSFTSRLIVVKDVLTQKAFFEQMHSVAPQGLDEILCGFLTTILPEITQQVIAEAARPLPEPEPLELEIAKAAAVTGNKKNLIEDLKKAIVKAAKSVDVYLPKLFKLLDKTADKPLEPREAIARLGARAATGSAAPEKKAITLIDKAAYEDKEALLKAFYEGAIASGKFDLTKENNSNNNVETELGTLVLYEALKQLGKEAHAILLRDYYAAWPLVAAALRVTNPISRAKALFSPEAYARIAEMAKDYAPEIKKNIESDNLDELEAAIERYAQGLALKRYSTVGRVTTSEVYSFMTPLIGSFDRWVEFGGPSKVFWPGRHSLSIRYRLDSREDSGYIMRAADLIDKFVGFIKKGPDGQKTVLGLFENVPEKLRDYVKKGHM